MPTIGWLSLMFPVEPKNLAEPNEKMPPSDATIQYPGAAVALAVRSEAWAVKAVGAARGRTAVTATAAAAASRRRSRVVRGVSEGVTAPLREEVREPRCGVAAAAGLLDGLVS